MCNHLGGAGHKQRRPLSSILLRFSAQFAGPDSGHRASFMIECPECRVPYFRKLPYRAQKRMPPRAPARHVLQVGRPFHPVRSHRLRAQESLGVGGCFPISAAAFSRKLRKRKTEASTQTHPTTAPTAATTTTTTTTATTTTTTNYLHHCYHSHHMGFRACHRH